VTVPLESAVGRFDLCSRTIGSRLDAIRDTEVKNEISVNPDFVPKIS